MLLRPTRLPLLAALQSSRNSDNSGDGRLPALTCRSISPRRRQTSLSAWKCLQDKQFPTSASMPPLPRIAGKPYVPSVQVRDISDSPLVLHSIWERTPKGLSSRRKARKSGRPKMGMLEVHKVNACCKWAIDPLHRSRSRRSLR
jgi:hypothetical protein